MADTKLTDLTANAAPISTDIMYLVDDPGGSPLSQKVTVAVLNAALDHGTLAGNADDDHTQYIKHSLATAANDFMIASGSGAFVKKTLAETRTILSLPPAGLTTKGDLIAAASSSDVQRLAVGANDTVLTADSTQTLGVKWAAPAATTAAASQAEQETGTSTTVYVSPGRQQYHASAAKAWVKWNGTGTVAINASYNVTSITDNGTGDYTINFTTSFSSANYAPAMMCGHVDTALRVGSQNFDATAGALRVQTTNANASLQDGTYNNVIVFGDQ